MSIKSISATIAMAAALSFGSAAFAQTMVGDQEVSEADMAAVTEHCASLVVEPNELADTQAGGEMAAGEPMTQSNPDGSTAGLDMDRITFEECQAAGLVEADGQ